MAWPRRKTEATVVVELEENDMHVNEKKDHDHDRKVVNFARTKSGGRGGALERTTLENRLSAKEMESITALSDTLLPSIEVLPAGIIERDAQSLGTLFLTSASMLGIPQVVGSYMSGRLQHAMLWLLRTALWLLSTWYGTFLLCGVESLSNRSPYFRKFSEIELRRREEILLSWSKSSIVYLRMLYRAIKYLVALFYFTQLDENNENPTWKALGYCGPDPQLQRQPQSTDDDDDHLMGPLRRCLVHVDVPRSALSAALAVVGIPLSARRIPGHDKPVPTIHCDAVIVGSGSGGGVVAGVLAMAGYKVVVIEKGAYFARAGLNLLEGPTLDQMYEGGGLVCTEDMGLGILSGSTVGGGSAINWAAALTTPEDVTKEWREELGLELFGSDAYEEALEAVITRMGMQHCSPCPRKESLGNAGLRKGCEQMGYPVKDVPRNAPQDRDCGWCCFGCRDGKKAAVSETWLVDMARSGNGVIIPNAKAVRVLHSSRNGQKSGRRHRVASGVLLEFGEDLQVCTIEGKATIVACGALGTPVLLRRSGLKNKHIGKNLHLHPVVMAWGYFPDKAAKALTDCKSYEGGIITAMSKVEPLDSSNYGGIIQTPSLHPGLFSVVTPWVSGTDFKARMARFDRTAHLFALSRDRGSGSVNSSGSVSYKLDKRDEAVLRKGIERMLRLMAAAGAEEVGTTNCDGERAEVGRMSLREWENFVRRSSMRAPAEGMPLWSAHQMGSCRMASEEGEGAVDGRGESWEVEGLYVADASVLPTAVGVNPMVTVQAIAYCTAQSVLHDLKRKLKKNMLPAC